MKSSPIELPSNRKFGFFFAFIFAVIAGYFYVVENEMWAYSFAVASTVVAGIALINAELLLPLNRLWMRFGFVLGTVVSPVVLGVIFFGIFTPMAAVMRLVGRDELRLRFTKEKGTHWVVRDEQVEPDSFENQF